jgi:serine/threonine protein kinase/tetratricopeptide (TPR) repeat protein
VAEPGTRKSGAKPAIRPPAGVPKDLLGRYEITGEIGVGGMGAVYRARDKQLGRDVAIKLVGDRKELTEMLAARLLREAQALAQLSHPNVVTIYDVGETEGRVFVVMELIHGVAGDDWIRKGGHSWQEVVRVFRDAGRGLAAAHAVGLVHRDFKPGNLMIGDDGRVRVLDFGLARTATAGTMSSDAALTISTDEISGDHEDTQAPTRAKNPARATSETVTLGPGDASEPAFVSQRTAAGSLLESPLTQVGVVVGTPPYMAPEQHLGGASDARSDQFGYCVSFFRALYGQRPFAGNTYGEVKAAILAGNLRPPPANADVPSWVRDIVLRGLAKEPEKRWPSMNDLLDALSRDPAVRRRKLLIGAAAALFVVGAGGAVWYAKHSAAVSCEVDRSELAGVWDASQKAAIENAFTKSGKPFAASAVATVTRKLDDYTNRWLAMHVEACKATHVHGTQSAELLDLRMECLQRRLDDVRALVGVLVNADTDVVTHAIDVTSGLPTLDGCADAEALRAPVRPPADPTLQKRVVAAQRTLASVNALWNAGRYLEAQRQLAPALAEAHALAWRPLEGEALLADARLADSTGDYQRAAKSFKEAAVAAEAGRDDETAALARNGLVWVTGERLGKYAEAQELAVDAAAKVERLGRSEILQADLDQKMSALFYEQGNLEEAAKRSKRVLEIRRKVLEPDDPAIASALSDLGDIAVGSAQYDDAIDDYRKALVIAERALGPEHSFCGTLRGNLGNALASKGQTTEALQQLDRARTITERALGPDHAQLATISLNIGNILLDQHKPAEAAPYFDKAAKIFTKALGADHPNVATAVYRGGEVALAQGHAHEAAAAFQRALEIWQAKLGVDHPSLAAAYIGLADAASADNHMSAALVNYQRALDLLQKAFGPTHVELVSVLVSIGTAQQMLGKSKPALASLDRALRIVEAGTDPVEKALGRFSVARALVKLDKSRANTLATAAHEALMKAGADHASEDREVTAWLAEHF